MSWTAIGTISPGLENWTSWGAQVSGGELFRVTQSWQGVYPGVGYAQLRQRWEPEGVHSWDRIYPSEEPILLRLSIPPELRAADKIARHIEGRLHSRAIIPINSNWQITLEVWTGALPTMPTYSSNVSDPYNLIPAAYRNLDGGTY